MSKIKDALKKGLDGLKRWGLILLGDIRSALVASIFAAVGAFVGTVYAQVQERDSFTINLSDIGVGYPVLLFDQARREDKNLRIDFSPPSLQRAAVCEYFSAKGQTFRDIMDSYLKIYLACFIPVWRDKGALEIRPNRYTGQLTVRVNNQGHESFWCKCARDQMPPQR
jgi:hypothetical protein